MCRKSSVSPAGAVALLFEMITFEASAKMRIPNELPVRFSPERKNIHLTRRGSIDVGCRASDLVPAERNWT
jgi:hypothetical protein